MDWVAEVKVATADSVEGKEVSTNFIINCYGHRRHNSYTHITI